MTGGSDGGGKVRAGVGSSMTNASAPAARSGTLPDTVVGAGGAGEAGTGAGGCGAGFEQAAVSTSTNMMAI